MSSEAHLGGTSDRDPLKNVPAECYDVFRHPRRIRVLEILGTHRTRLSLAELTTAIIERETGGVSTGKARHEIRTSLVHNHLPRLADAGLLEFDADTGAELVDESPVHPADLSGLLDLCAGPDGQALLEAIVHPVRIRIVSMLSAATNPVSVDQFAAKLAASSVDSLTDAERAKLKLHHAHLPRLADAGILEFDADSGLVVADEQAMSIAP
ncbi:DUF7344 domain-containing protein [Natronolimnohabitans innermongolicus]|uniref:DUF7344 domain-containing protein n=1 Tax=Natronolimnohabitans innermongolicus JCM 12255 TaxID=1227499 RepID=L9XAV3_9EURY|nr:hypothetical protein [Natronolimnohabitans innermongolicus]ELY58772.1 hypothetical protein C493_06377 [Natronolimnohabitans innermongolicus JCM 12255]